MVILETRLGMFIEIFVLNSVCLHWPCKAPPGEWSIKIIL